MRLHPLLDDPGAALVVRSPSVGHPGAEHFRSLGRRILEGMQIELEGEAAALKPNVTGGEHFADPESGITTHPSFVQGMLEYLLEHGLAPAAGCILEDPRDTDDDEPRHWRGTGYPEVAEATGVALRCPTTDTCVELPVARPLAFTALKVSRLAVAPRTVLFNIPKLKTHNLAITSLCIKNLMGLVNVFDRHYCAQAWHELPAEVTANTRPRHLWFDAAMHLRFQEGLARRLADTARVIRPRINVVEGVVGREGSGFLRGRNRPLGLAIAGVNPVVVDTVASYLMGFDPRAVAYLRIAADAGLGTNDLAAIRVYELRDSAVVPCRNLSSLRVDPPFRCLRGIKGELGLDGEPAPADGWG